ncbi:WXG100 family type VII secretion target [Microbacterium sp. NPDC058342]|uniref:WXG100 family type VII secretion target n=1 Tax=Microbacterium sp. NPDC058342 TaxID=3346454 RepID=UPI003650BB18
MDFGTVEMAGTDLGSGANNIETKLTEMENALKPLQADWTGSASEAYTRAKAQWNAALTEMKQLLAEIGKQVIQDSADGHANEKKNEGRW